MSAVVRISGTRKGTPVRGSGFVVGLDRDKATVVTASHVIEGAQQLEVTFAVDPTESFPAGVVLGMDAANPHGLAVFQVRGSLPPGVTALSFEVENQPRIGESLFLLGFLEMAPAPRATQRVLSSRSGTLLLVDQRIGESFSGGPVLQRGRVVGVVTETDEQTTYAVTAVVVRVALEGWGVKFGGQSSPPMTSTATQTKPVAPAPEKCVPGKERIEASIVFVRICPGTFTMGSAEKDPKAFSNEKPAHQVTLSEFWIGKTEITNEQYRGFRSDHQGEARVPATGVSWNDAKAACEHFGSRLPTEAEWEYAARAGSQTAWSFGDDEKRLSEYAWYDEREGIPHTVGTKKPNAWGLHDVHGNAWEWVADWHGTYSAATKFDPAGPTTGMYRVLRGGSIINVLTALRSAARIEANPAKRNSLVGFRCARGPGRTAQTKLPWPEVTVYFSSGSARLSNIAKAKLDEVALWMLQDATLHAQVIGHEAASSSPGAAQRISEQRAEAVKNYLFTRHHIDLSRITTEGRGAADPSGYASADHVVTILALAQ
ncbi:MAG TPA: SUMF1/EgtB/PvdO family nonheme iron enzyme [Thermoanaerobaculia bacterium]|nr:SUMF1/EgtB/PvdO family nonheme iron enzyme [Thermoanaerobaculia bacterium]